MSTKKTRFSLKKKLIILLVSMIAAISALSGLFCFKGLTDINRTMYTERATGLAATAAAALSPEDVKAVRDRVLEIYSHTEDKVSNESWEEPGYEAYLEKYSDIPETEEFKRILDVLTLIQDNNNLNAVYIICFDQESESTIYLADATHGEDNCPPGSFDAVMYDVDKAAMQNPKNGIEADVTNTEEYGWVVAAGSPIFTADGELIGFAGADISMNEVMAQRDRFMAIALAALLVLAIFFIAISILLIDRIIIRPINTLSDTSEKYWSGESSEIRHEFSQIQIHTGDEIETLSNSMKQMEQNINEQITKILETTQTLITTREHADEMDRAANIDALTKVRNKRAYDIETERVNEEIRAGKTDIGVGMIDLNYLKKINDTYGHEKGDQTIQLLCRIICRVFQHSPIFRIGGDEFVVILENHDFDNLESLKAELERDIAATQSRPDPWERVSAAAGFAVFDPAADRELESVFKRADQLMYERKKQMKAERTE